MYVVIETKLKLVFINETVYRIVKIYVVEKT